MVTINKIYTKTGDKGDTVLGDGTRTAKDSLRVETYGTVDELNSVLGLARLHASGTLEAQIAHIQNTLFDLGAGLAVPTQEAQKQAQLQTHLAAQTERLEQQIDAMNADLAPLKSFVLPGGSILAAHLHLARTVARRSERLTVTLAREETISQAAIQYLNRLSDWCFTAARAANDNGKDDILWAPGGA